MTFSPLDTPTDPTPLLAHMGARALLSHVRAAIAQLAALGVEVVPAVNLAVDELDEAVLEHDARRDPLAVARALAAAQADLAAAVPA